MVGWLYRSMRYAVLARLRQERRRLARETEAMKQLESDPEPAPDWHCVRSVLDEALDGLKDEERDAVLLRFFKNQDLRAVGDALGVSADAAQKRVTRALEKIRTRLQRRGIRTTSEALSSALLSNAVQTAPAGLAATLTTESLVRVASQGGLTLLNAYSWLMGLVFFGIVAVVLVVIPVFVRHRAEATLRQLVTQADRDIGGLTRALEAFEVDNGFFPKSETGLRALATKPPEARFWKGPYLLNMPQDPWGHDYIYISPGRHRPNYFDLSSSGPDGRVGTEDDITNWRPGYPAPLRW